MTTVKQPHTLNPELWNVEYRSYLTRIAVAKVNDYQIAEDLVQDTFIAAWKAKDRFRGECTEKTWLSGILRNKIIDFYRSRGRRPAIVASQLENRDKEDLTGWMESRADDRTDLNPTKVAERGDFMDQLNDAVEKLPGKMGKAFRLWLMQDLSTEEVTRRLDISTSNLWVLIHRAKKALKAELGSDWRDVSFASNW
ncbi:MAG: sigma-70 family RNA polymerase sigma factor [Verrucomicrobiales bacterium]|nr:sigma-70 family RNA polymerase sigma factor [Verrucomicrobiales bacterium]